MALSIRLSLGICLLFISGATWLLHGVARPMEAIASPLVDSAPMDRPLVFGRSSGGAARLASATARFEAASVVDRGVVQRDWDEPELVISRATEVSPRETIELPPLVAPLPVGGEVQPAVAAAEPVRAMTVGLEESGTLDTPASVEESVVKALPEPVYETYVVRRGDSLVRIARRFWSKSGPAEIKLLLAANPQLADHPDRLMVGEKIVIPDPTAALSLARSTPQDGPVTPGAHATPVAAVEAQTTSDVWWYTIQERDSLSGIARRLLKDERRWVEIKKLNRMADGNVIRPGMRIKLPALGAAING